MNLLPLHTLPAPGTRTATLRFEVIEPKKDSSVSASHRHDYYEIFLFGKGGGTHMIDFAHHPLEDSSLHLVTPGQVHQLSREAGSSGLVLMFSKDFLLSLLDFSDAAPRLPLLEGTPVEAATKLTLPDFLLLQSLFQEITGMRPQAGAEWQNPALVRALVKVVVLKCAELMQPKAPACSGTPTDAAGCRLARQFTHLVEAHFTQLHQVADYADKLAVTSGHLNVVSKSWLGKTARAVIQERLLLEAKRLLLHSEQAAKEIAYELHFEDPSHFAKFFKSQCGVSPSQFRQHMREMYQQ